MYFALSLPHSRPQPVLTDDRVAGLQRQALALERLLQIGQCDLVRVW